MRHGVPVFVSALLLGGGLALGVAPTVGAQPRAAAHPKRAAQPAKKKGGKAAASAEVAPADSAAPPVEPAAAPKPRAVGAPASAADAGAGVVGVSEQGDSGVKTYKFGVQEVEGRLKSPQVLYFLRRVRAEFASGELGHRSFMRELSDTRRDPAFR
ncbi:MAG: hypothetical protein OZ921_15775 [Sorangiineae bacterium]|nr:hypothetical protein [Polyangiaceae bacterium]MEB2323971.1 hypothetical protein [Sorangiineae bacterium]